LSRAAFLHVQAVKLQADRPLRFAPWSAASLARRGLMGRDRVLVIRDSRSSQPFPDQGRKYTCWLRERLSRRAGIRLRHPYINISCSGRGYVGQAALSRVVRGSPCFSICEAVAHREGSRPRDPSFAKLTAFPDQGRKIDGWLREAFAARGSLTGIRVRGTRTISTG